MKSALPLKIGRQIIEEPEIVDAFLAARRDTLKWEQLDDRFAPKSIEDGYRLQRAIHQRLEAMGDRRVGYKIGATSRPGQAIYGLDEPIYAGIFASTRASSLEGALSDLVAPSVECELGIVLGRDLDGTQLPISPAHAVEAIATCHVACEIIDNRYGNPLKVGTPTVLADDFFNAGFVLGPPVLWQNADLANLRATVVVNGLRTGNNPGDVLDPLSALIWLAEKLVQHGRPLRAGEIILTGSITPPVPLTFPVISLSMSVLGLGEMTASGRIRI